MKIQSPNKSPRRTFIKTAGVLALGMPYIIGCKTKPETTKTKDGKLGIALVGLGNYSKGQLGPALLQTEHCKLDGIVTGTPSKIPEWQEKYAVPDTGVYNYENFDEIAKNKAIDIVYVVLPNSMHEEYVIRAAKAGKHVITEKPMGLNAASCQRMIDACDKAGVKLAVGYRCHFEPFNKEMMRLGQNKVYGEIKAIESGFGFTIGDPTQWRLKKEMAGGGPLMDVGIYSIQALCYTTGMLPVALTAIEGKKTDFQKFSSVEQSLSWEFEFPNGLIGKGKSAYDQNYNFVHADAEKGWFELTSAFGYDGLKGATSDGPMTFSQTREQSAHMDDFSMAIKDRRPSPVSGQMGKRDLTYIDAIFESMENGGKRMVLKS